MYLNRRTFFLIDRPRLTRAIRPVEGPDSQRRDETSRRGVTRACRVWRPFLLVCSRDVSPELSRRPRVPRLKVSQDPTGAHETASRRQLFDSDHG